MAASKEGRAVHGIDRGWEEIQLEMCFWNHPNDRMLKQGAGSVHILICTSDHSKLIQ